MRRLTFALALWLAVHALAGGVSAAEPVRFCLASDNRGNAGFVTILERIAQLPGGAGQFVVSVGDSDPVPVTRHQLEAVFGKSFAWYPAVGNHETGAAIPGATTDNMKALRDYYAERLKGKVNPGPEGTSETTYSFDAGDVHIVVLNLYWNGKTGPDSDRKGTTGVAEPLRRWLRYDLQKSRKPWKLVVGHEPAFPQPDQDWKGARHAEDALTLNEGSRDAFWSILEEQGVAAYICAHTHRYSRYKPEGSKVWQIDTAQARGNKDWKYDAFVIVTADEKGLKFSVYRNLKKQGQFEETDSLVLQPAAAPATAAPVSR